QFGRQRVIFRGHSLLVREVQFLQLGKTLFRHQFGRTRRKFSTDGGLRPEQVPQITLAETVDNKAPTRHQAHKRLALQQQQALAHEQAVAAKDDALAAKLGHRFHRTINLAADSPRLALLLGSLTKQLPNRFYTSIEGQLEGALEYHPIIMKAIRVHDAEAVRSLMYRHILSGAEHLIDMLDRQGMWGDGNAAAAPAAEYGKPKTKTTRKTSTASAL
ncbi:MAG: hypothetical protein RLZZ371_2369, partial [Pseudomonadota bacterium]